MKETSHKGNIFLCNIRISLLFEKKNSHSKLLVSNLVFDVIIHSRVLALGNSKILL